MHVTCLRAAGHQTAAAGARIACQALQRPRGIQAFRILHLDMTTAHHAPVDEAEDFAVRSETGWQTRIVKWFNRVRGFGYIDGGPGVDIFVSADILRRCGMTELRPGQLIEVRWGIGPFRPTAIALRAPRDGRR